MTDLHMTREQREDHVIGTVDTIASRLKLWTTAVIAVGGVVAFATAGAVKWVTRDVHEEIAQTRQELREYIRYEQVRATADSVRLENGLDIVELAVVALVEPAGSQEQRNALVALRARRHYVPK